MAINSLKSDSAPSGGSARIPGALEHVQTQSFFAVPSVSLDRCFTGQYANYRALLHITASSTNAYTEFRMRLAGVDASGANYTFQQTEASGASVSGLSVANATQGRVNYHDSTYSGAPTTMEIFAPALAQHTSVIALGYYREVSATTMKMRQMVNHHAIALAYDGLTILPSGGTITGTISVFGYGDDARYAIGDGMVVATGTNIYMSENYS
jgi:hypothetical protein